MGESGIRPPARGPRAAGFAAAYRRAWPVSSGIAREARVLTRRGETLLGEIRIGDEVLSASGRWERVAAIEPGGCGAVVRVVRDAFGPGEPHRDVLIGADQVVSVRGRPEPARRLVDATAIRPERPAEAGFVRLALERDGFAMVDGLNVALPAARGARIAAGSGRRRVPAPA